VICLYPGLAWSNENGVSLMLMQDEIFHPPLENGTPFRQLYDHMALGVARISLDFRIEGANRAYCRMLGYTEAELVGKHIREVTQKDILPHNLQQQHLLGAGRIDHYRMEKIFIHKNGGVVYGILDANLIRDSRGNPSYFLGSVLDITERRKAEKALAENEERLSLAMEASRTGICDWDVNTGEVSYNAVWGDILGYDPDEILPRLSFWQDRIHPADKARTLESLTAHLKGKQWLFEIEHRLKHKSGEWIWILAKGRTTRWGEDQNPSRVSIIMMDINAHRELEARLNQKDKLEAVGTLAGGIAHDFNNILFPVIGFAEMLKGDLDRESRLHGYVDEILKASLRARDLVRQILMFSRKNEQVIVPIDLGPVVRESLKLLRASIPTTCNITHEITRDCGSVVADPTQIHQVVMNLVTNAFQSLEGGCGGVAVTLGPVSGKEVPTSVSELSGCPLLKLSVTDTGKGMDKETQSKIFDPYFTTKPIGRGTGLGLSTVSGIIKHIGGTIQVHSHPGRGTRIEIFLPLVRTAAAETAQPSGEAPAQTGNEQILLVDDEAPVLSTTEMMISRLGYRVNAKLSSKEALEEFKRNPDTYDVVITDMTMPEMTGDLLAGKIKKIRPGLPVILCSGFTDELDGQMKKEMGIDEFLPKPATLKSFSAAINKVLS